MFHVWGSGVGVWGLALVAHQNMTLTGSAGVKAIRQRLANARVRPCQNRVWQEPPRNAVGANALYRDEP